MFSTIKESIIYEDACILILDKPSGVVVNISETSSENTVQNFLKEYLNIPQDESEFFNRTGLVHRLDKDTSGLLVIAKTPEAFEDLKEKFKKRRVEKDYLAVCLGHIDDRLLTIDAPIKRNPDSRMKMIVHSEGRTAKTKIELLGNTTYQDLEVSFIRAKPFTGRTHQIRVHLAAFGHPVMGDSIYMTKKIFYATKPIFPRLMLHAYKISFKHPETQKELFFDSTLPELFAKIGSEYL